MSDVRLILGKRGSGKSWALREMIRGEPRVLLYDTLHEPAYDEFRRIDKFPELCKLLIENPPIFRVAYSWDGVAEHETDFDRACHAVFACRGLTFAVEEVEMFTSPSFIPKSLRKIVSLGRHRELSLWIATRRPKEVHPLIRSQANRVVSFSQSEPADLEWCRQVMGDMTDGLPQLDPNKHQSVTWYDRPQKSP